jgi:hypothetical protein
MSISPNPLDEPPVYRTKTTTVWLWLVIVLNVGFGVFAFNVLTSLPIVKANYMSLVTSALIMILSCVDAFGTFMILKWKKVGFYIVLASAAADILVALFTGGNILYAIAKAVFNLNILYFVLQFPKGNTAWGHLT